METNLKYQTKEKAVRYIKKLMATDSRFRGQKEIAELLDCPQPNVSRFLKSPASFSFTMLDNLLLKMPTARSFIYDSSNEAKKLNHDDDEYMTIPLIRAHASLPEGWGDIDYVMEDGPTYKTKRRDDGQYCAFEVSGDSMDDGSKYSICEGDIVTARALQRHHWFNKLHIPKVFVIVHRERGAMIKQIIAHDIVNHTIACHSFNTEFPDFVLKLDEIDHLFYYKDHKVAREM